MEMKQRARSVCIGALTAMAVATQVGTASARTSLALSGTTNHTVSDASFGLGSLNGVVQLLGGGPAPWLVPLHFDTFGTKTITIRGRAQASGSLSCFAAAVTTSGTTITSSSFVSFPANGAYTSITVTLSAIPTNAAGLVACNISANQTAELVNVQYTP